MTQLDRNTPRHPIRVVARRTGLKADLIRAWERRYGAIEPRRTVGKHRLYSDADIERLILLRRATNAWRNIGQVANLSDEALRQLAEQEEQEIHPAPVVSVPSTSWRTEPQIEACLSAITRLDTKEFTFLLERAAVDLSPNQLFSGLLTPLMREVGRRWHLGLMQPMHEHLASAVVRSFVGGLITRYPQPAGAPSMIVTTPAGQRHELGALLVAAMTAAESWQVAYLGADLAAREIAAAARERKARAVALSLVYPNEDPQVIGELHELAELLEPDVSILVGGQSAGAYRQHLRAIQAIQIDDFGRLRDVLTELRTRPRWRPRPELKAPLPPRTRKPSTRYREERPPRLGGTRRQLGHTFLCITRNARTQYGLDDSWIGQDGFLTLKDLSTTRQLAEKINQRRRQKRHPIRQIRAGELHGAGLVQTYSRQLLEAYRLERVPDLWTSLSRWLGQRFGREKLFESLRAFAELFQVDPRPSSAAQDTNNGPAESDLTEHGESLLCEMLLLWIANQNPAFEALHDLIDDQNLQAASGYHELMLASQDFFNRKPGYGPTDQNLIDLLRSPIRRAPESLNGQLEVLVEFERKMASSTIDQLLIGLDVLKEEEGPKFVDPTGGGPPAPPPEAMAFDAPAPRTERLSQDRPWMARAVVMSKNVFVWLTQLSHAYRRPIERLDQIPDAELRQLVQRGMSDLWLVGLWQRSDASKRIKHQCGDPTAEASAYALTTYRIARELGGEIAFEHLRKRAEKLGLRVACDIVPNHTGIDSKWMIEHPDRFLSVEKCPFPGYTFKGPDLSPDPRISLYLEDHYYDRSDAAVVFKRVDKKSGEVRYVYHGNDGTGLPWNDTAQLDYLDTEVRRAVTDTILQLAKRFPVIRVDAAMTLVKQHIQRLWFPAPGQGGAIPSRTEHGLSKQEFERLMPREFWSEVVERLAEEAPDTMLVAEGFWMMEDFFIRELGVHRVYNSAFMHMLRDGNNSEYRATLRNALRTDPRILQRLVNFLTNPDEIPTAQQLGIGERYFALCTLLATVPGLPLFGHGQFEGLREKYGMEYRHPRTDESADPACLAQHETRIAPLLQRRQLFAGTDHFRLFDCVDGTAIHEDVLALTNRHGRQQALILVHNRDAHVRGVVRHSALYLDVQDGIIKQDTLIPALGLSDKEDRYFACRDVVTGLDFSLDRAQWTKEGLAIALGPYEHHVLVNFRPISSEEARRLPTLEGDPEKD